MGSSIDHVILPILGLGALILAVYILSHRWVWTVIFFVATLFSFFTMLACIVAFQIFAAVGLFFLTWFLVWCLGAINQTGES